MPRLADYILALDLQNERQLSLAAQHPGYKPTLVDTDALRADVLKCDAVVAVARFIPSGDVDLETIDF